MLQNFHRSFNLPGLRLELVQPVCSEDYLPEEEPKAEFIAYELMAAGALSWIAAASFGTAPRGRRRPHGGTGSD
jgi:hypothetical protein